MAVSVGVSQGVLEATFACQYQVTHSSQSDAKIQTGADCLVSRLLDAAKRNGLFCHRGLSPTIALKLSYGYDSLM